MGFQMMESSGPSGFYWFRAQGTTKNFKFYQRAFNELGFQFIGSMNSYRISITQYPDLNTAWNAVCLRADQLLVIHEKSKEEQPIPELTIDIPLKRDMFGYQKQGVAYMISKQRAFNCDQQGLGKSVQALAAAIGLGCQRILVVCKLSLCMNWEREVKEWTYLEPLIFRDSIRGAWPMYFDTGMAQVGIVNYDSLEKYFVRRIETPSGKAFTSNDIVLVPKFADFDCIIIDESHYGKDPSTKRTKMLVAMCRPKKNVFLLSGTPILNDAFDIYAQACMLNMEHRLAASPSAFQDMYSGKGNKNLQLLNGLLRRNGYIRRLKKDVLKELPEKTRQKIIVPISNQEEYDLAERDFVKFLQQNMKKSMGQISQALRAQALVQLMQLKRVAARGKIYSAVEWCTDLNRDGQKVVIFAHHKDVIKDLKAGIPGSVTIAGWDDMETREANKRKFIEQADTMDIICSIGAAAEGHTLVVASYLGMVEMPWHFGKLEQCEDRIHRIGQQDGATIGIFIGKGTIDEHIYTLIMKKKEMHDQVTGTDEEVSTDVVDDLINLLIKKQQQHDQSEYDREVETQVVQRDPPRLEID